MPKPFVAPEPTCLARDGDLWVLHKPAEMPVHPVHQQKHQDLMAWCVEHLGAPSSLAPCHRLDKPTSGVVLASPNPEIRRTVGEAFAAQTVAKTYSALIYGRLEGEGLIERALDDQRRRKRLAATTHYTVVERFRRLSLLEVTPKHLMRGTSRGKPAPKLHGRAVRWA